MNQINTITIDDLKVALNEIHDFETGTSKSDDDIRSAEEALSVKLPESFKQYLKHWGNISFGPVEYYGLTNSSDYENSSIPNFVWFTLRKREDVNLPESLVVFQSLNDEVYYCLDTSCLDRENECPVVAWDNINRCINSDMKITFFAFFIDDIEEYIDTFQ